jgi:hypothetical protein
VRRVPVSRLRQRPLRLPLSRRRPATNTSVMPSTSPRDKKRPRRTASPKFSRRLRERATIRAIQPANSIPVRSPRSRSFSRPMALIPAGNWTRLHCRSLGSALTLPESAHRSQLFPVAVRAPRLLRRRQAAARRPQRRTRKRQRQPRLPAPPRVLFLRTQNPSRSSGPASDRCLRSPGLDAVIGF